VRQLRRKRKGEERWLDGFFPCPFSSPCEIIVMLIATWAFVAAVTMMDYASAGNQELAVKPR